MPTQDRADLREDQLLANLERSYGTATARYYDAAYAGDTQLAGDVEFYTSLARECGGPVLELACGTGRVLLEISRLGIPCTGLDASQAMLSAFRAKSPPPTLRLVRAPMQRFSLDGDRFGLIFSAFRAFQHRSST
jgi:ubiquinone/menaquinone biosynthesis C-methylase UbiE